MRNGKSKYVLMINVIIHATTARITVTKGYMHLWHVCQIMTNDPVGIFVTVHNLPIGFFIMEKLNI